MQGLLINNPNHSQKRGYIHTQQSHCHTQGTIRNLAFFLYQKTATHWTNFTENLLELQNAIKTLIRLRVTLCHALAMISCVCLTGESDFHKKKHQELLTTTYFALENISNRHSLFYLVLPQESYDEQGDYIAMRTTKVYFNLDKYIQIAPSTFANSRTYMKTYMNDF